MGLPRRRQVGDAPRDGSEAGEGLSWPDPTLELRPAPPAPITALARPFSDERMAPGSGGMRANRGLRTHTPETPHDIASFRTVSSYEGGRTPSTVQRPVTVLQCCARSFGTPGEGGAAVPAAGRRSARRSSGSLGSDGCHRRVLRQARRARRIGPRPGPPVRRADTSRPSSGQPTSAQRTTMRHRVWWLRPAPPGSSRPSVRRTGATGRPRLSTHAVNKSAPPAGPALFSEPRHANPTVAHHLVRGSRPHLFRRRTRGGPLAAEAWLRHPRRVHSSSASRHGFEACRDAARDGTDGGGWDAKVAREQYGSAPRARRPGAPRRIPDHPCIGDRPRGIALSSHL